MFFVLWIQFRVFARCECLREGFICPRSGHFFGISDLFLLDHDTFTARDPWTWRLSLTLAIREVMRVIPYASKLDTAAQAQDGQHIDPVQRSFSDG